MKTDRTFKQLEMASTHCKLIQMEKNEKQFPFILNIQKLKNFLRKKKQITCTSLLILFASFMQIRLQLFGENARGLQIVLQSFASTLK